MEKDSDIRCIYVACYVLKIPFRKELHKEVDHSLAFQISFE